jgi:hypothetical protein
MRSISHYKTRTVLGLGVYRCRTRVNRCGHVSMTDTDTTLTLIIYIELSQIIIGVYILISVSCPVSILHRFHI